MKNVEGQGYSLQI